GQYFTPRPLVELVADLAQLRPGDRVLDPTCGSGGFLVAALARGADADGIEVDPDLVALARLNVALHGGNPRGVVAADFFAAPDDGDRWDAILANPPFSVEVADPAVLARYALARGRARVGSDILFVEAALARLKPGGRLVTVLPYTVLSGAPFAAARAWIDSVAEREAVVSLPEGMFRPFGGTPTRACVIALRKRPAEVRPMLAAVIDSPGYDTRRQTFRRTEPDELVALRLHLHGGPYARACRVEGSGWIPEEALRASAIAPGVPVFVLSERADLVRGRAALDPSADVTVVDFADVDKGTGEVVDARVEPGATCEGVSFDEGDLLFGRMRPELNNVVLAVRPRPGLPARMAGSGEWVRLRPRGQAAFTLLALRSRFARAQLVVTGGQTRPRARIEDIAALQLPDPGPAARAALDALLTETWSERLRLRQRLTALDALYDRFGRGEVDAASVEAEVLRLRSHAAAE
ncbi:MAG: N-6 DNA methylase, partial [Pseudomonadota bacterium]|nr:N-6 DNA methylase [Pseudomonadota bacterium]